MFKPLLERYVGFVTHLCERLMCFISVNALCVSCMAAKPSEKQSQVIALCVSKTVGVGGEPFLSDKIEQLQAYDLENWNCAY